MLVVLKKLNIYKFKEKDLLPLHFYAKNYINLITSTDKVNFFGV